MRHSSIFTVLALAASLLSPAFVQGSADDQVSFPAIGELDIVFPRNETYAVEAPFPFILGFHNAPVVLAFPHFLDWTVNCTGDTLFGGGQFDDDVPAPSNDYFFLNATETLAKKGREDSQFTYWGDREQDHCMLEWTFTYVTTCEPLPDGGEQIMSGYFGVRRGNVEFTLKPGATRPKDAIAAYDGCALAGTALGLASNISTCPQIAKDSSPKPKPCELDVKGAASSLAAAVVSPTTSLTKVPKTTTTTTTTPTTTDTIPSSGPTNDATSGGDGDDTDAGGDNDDGAGSVRAPIVQVGIVALTVIAVILGGFTHV